ncbi:MAG: hypothetical protein EA398_04395 [Deltaproteobacteria bacterium]|nr:MAG: hypothetical protein EA398_04395 [Deltaproteobacteria bacterium]
MKFTRLLFILTLSLVFGLATAWAGDSAPCGGHDDDGDGETVACGGHDDDDDGETVACGGHDDDGEGETAA